MKFKPARPFESLENAAKILGVSVYFLRQGCKDGSIPHIKTGKKYLVNIYSFFGAVRCACGGDR